jgi:hypothetical protein
MKCAWVRTPQPAVIKNNLAPGDFVILFFSLLFLFYFSPYYLLLKITLLLEFLLFYFSPYHFILFPSLLFIIFGVFVICCFISLPTIFLFLSLLFLFYFSPCYFRLSVILFYFSPYYFYFISLPTIFG